MRSKPERKIRETILVPRPFVAVGFPSQVSPSVAEGRGKSIYGGCAMSVRIMGKVFDLDLGTRDKFVLIAMADHADHDGTGVYPGNKLLSEKTNYSKQTVRRAQKSLREKGYIEPIENHDPDERKAKEWKISIPPSPQSEGTPPLTDKGPLPSECREGSPQNVGSTVNNNRKEESSEEKKPRARKVFEHWQSKEQLTTHRKFDGHRKRVKARFNDGWTVDELKEAIDNYCYLLNKIEAGAKVLGIHKNWTLEQFLKRGGGAKAQQIWDNPDDFIEEYPEGEDGLTKEELELRERARKATQQAKELNDD